MNNATNIILSNINRIPSDLHASILALLSDAATLASVRALVGTGTLSGGAASATAAASAVSSMASFATASDRPCAAPPALKVEVKPRDAESVPKRIYVTAPTYMQRDHRKVVESAIAAVKRTWPHAEIIDANTHWPDGERRGAAWEAGYSELVKTIDMIVVVTGPEGWIGGGIEREIDVARGAGRHVLATRTPGDGLFFFYESPVYETYKGTGSRSHIPKDIRGGIKSKLILDESCELTISRA